MTKQTIIILVLFSFLGCSVHKNLFSKNANTDYKKDFPDSQYLSAKGSGKTELDAKMQARAELTSIFESQIISDLSSHTESVTNSSGNQTFSKIVKANIQVVSSAKINGIETGKTWFDENAGIYYALAVLDRYKAKSIWQQEIEQINSKIKALLNTKNTSNILRLVNLKKIADLWVEQESAIVRLKIAGFADAGATDFDIKEIFNEIVHINSRLRIYVQITGVHHNFIKEYISQALSQQGFILTDKKEDADTFVTGKSNVRQIQIKRQDNVRFASAEISLSITDLYGNKIFETVKKKRGAHKDYNEAVYRAIKKCSEIIAKQFCNF